DGLTRLFFGHTPQAVAQVHLKHPRAEAFVVGMAANPEAFGPLKAVGSLVEIIQPLHRALDFRRLPLHRVGRDVARPLDRLRLRIGDLGLKLSDLIVLVNDEGGQEGRRHSENTSQHSGWIVLGCRARVSAWTSGPARRRPVRPRPRRWRGRSDVPALDAGSRGCPPRWRTR